MMQRNCILFVIFLIAFFLYFPSLIFGYDDETTHRMININAVERSSINMVLKNRYGFYDGIEEKLNENTVKLWIEEGGEREDDDFSVDGAGIRYRKHFHDPLIEDWGKAGLKGMFDSALLWALNVPDEVGYKNGFSWNSARELFYVAVTTGDEKDYAQTFRALGQLMHLVSDMAVPAHVRDDAHPGKVGWLIPSLRKDKYEIWVSEKQNEINFTGQDISMTIFNNAVLGHTTESWNNPISALWDQDVYHKIDPSSVTWGVVGLAEYTNANYLSDNTIFEGYTYPSRDETNYNENIWQNPEEVDAEDGEVDKRIYFKKETGTPIEHFAAAGYYFWQLYMWNKPELNYTFILDEKCYEDYATELIPRAVGYSSALLDYFFRGDFDVSQALLKRNNLGELIGLDLMIKNTSKLDESSNEIEAFSDGEVSLVCKYIPVGEDEYEYSLIENAYTVYGANDPINSEYVSINQNFDIPIPLDSTDMSLNLIFRGKMGNEPDAVAARVFKITSRIAYYTEPEEGDNTTNIFTVRPDGTDNRQITDTTEPNPRYYAPAWSHDGSLLAFNQANCDNVQPDGSCLWVDYEKNITVIEQPYSQAAYPDNVMSTLLYWDADKWDQPEAVHLQSFSFSPDGSQLVAVVRRYASDLGALVAYNVSQGSWDYLYNFTQGGDPSTARWYISDLINAPEWSPQGDAIAYCRAGWTFEGPGGTYGEAKSSIFIINPNTGERVQITNIEGDGYGEYDTTQPAWTIDGERILFVSDREEDGVPDIWIMDWDGANQEKVYNCAAECFSPTMSPDGQKIAFEMGSNIYTVNVDGSDLFKVTDSDRAKAPAWSPLMVEIAEP